MTTGSHKLPLRQNKTVQLHRISEPKCPIFHKNRKGTICSLEWNELISIWNTLHKRLSNVVYPAGHSSYIHFCAHGQNIFWPWIAFDHDGICLAPWSTSGRFLPNLVLTKENSLPEEVSFRSSFSSRSKCIFLLNIFLNQNLSPSQRRRFEVAIQKKVLSVCSGNISTTHHALYTFLDANNMQLSSGVIPVNSGQVKFRIFRALTTQQTKAVKILKLLCV